MTTHGTEKGSKEMTKSSIHAKKHGTEKESKEMAKSTIHALKFELQTVSVRGNEKIRLIMYKLFPE